MAAKTTIETTVIAATTATTTPITQRAVYRSSSLGEVHARYSSLQVITGRNRIKQGPLCDGPDGVEKSKNHKHCAPRHPTHHPPSDQSDSSKGEVRYWSRWSDNHHPARIRHHYIQRDTRCRSSQPTPEPSTKVRPANTAHTQNPPTSPRNPAIQFQFQFQSPNQIKVPKHPPESATPMFTHRPMPFDTLVSTVPNLHTVYSAFEYVSGGPHGNGHVRGLALDADVHGIGGHDDGCGNGQTSSGHVAVAPPRSTRENGQSATPHPQSSRMDKRSMTALGDPTIPRHRFRSYATDDHTSTLPDDQGHLDLTGNDHLGPKFHHEHSRVFRPPVITSSPFHYLPPNPYNLQTVDDETMYDPLEKFHLPFRDGPIGTDLQQLRTDHLDHQTPLDQMDQGDPHPAIYDPLTGIPLLENTTVQRSNPSPPPLYLPAPIPSTDPTPLRDCTPFNFHLDLYLLLSPPPRLSRSHCATTKPKVLQQPPPKVRSWKPPDQRPIPPKLTQEEFQRQLAQEVGMYLPPEASETVMVSPISPISPMAESSESTSTSRVHHISLISTRAGHGIHQGLQRNYHDSRRVGGSPRPWLSPSHSASARASRAPTDEIANQGGTSTFVRVLSRAGGRGIVPGQQSRTTKRTARKVYRGLVSTPEFRMMGTGKGGSSKKSPVKVCLGHPVQISVLVHIQRVHPRKSVACVAA